jgi:hypothetical protein
VRIAQETVTEEAGIKKISRNLAGSIDREGNRAVYRSWGIERGDRAVVIPNEAVLVAVRIIVSTRGLPTGAEAASGRPLAENEAVGYGAWNIEHCECAAFVPQEAMRQAIGIDAVSQYIPGVVDRDGIRAAGK